MSGCKGRYFHMETMGAVDGPGLRFVLFLQGCPLRCPYCHNPEGWAMEGGQEITAEQVVEKYRRYESYYKGGGITLTGGEPLVQAQFVNELLQRCREEGIHTALDTSGCVDNREAQEASDLADLILLDIKSPNPVACKETFGIDLDRPMSVLRRSQERGQAVWVRHVIAPGLTDSLESVERLRALLAPFSCVERVELLPFRKLCLEKYTDLGLVFPMGECEEPGEKLMRELNARWEG